MRWDAPAPNTRPSWSTVRSRPEASAEALSVSIARVKDGAVVWTHAYPAATADAATIAEDVDSKLPELAADEE